MGIALETHEKSLKAQYMNYTKIRTVRAMVDNSFFTVRPQKIFYVYAKIVL